MIWTVISSDLGVYNVKGDKLIVGSIRILACDQRPPMFAKKYPNSVMNEIFSKDHARQNVRMYSS